MKQREGKIDYGKFGINYVAGRKVCHLHVDGRNWTQCGLVRLGLRVKLNDGGPHVCKNCRKTVKVIKGQGKRIAVFRIVDAVISVVEKSERRDVWQS